MTYPITTSKLDAWTRGRVDMFARVVEIQNQHPRWVDDAAIDALYHEIKDACELKRIRAVMVEGVNIVEDNNE